jgi:zinc protease
MDRKEAKPERDARRRPDGRFAPTGRALCAAIARRSIGLRLASLSGLAPLRLPARETGVTSRSFSRRSVRCALFACVALVIVACGPKHTGAPQADAMPWAKSGVDWSKPPAVATTDATIPTILERKVGNVDVLVVENHRLPIVAITAVNETAGATVSAIKPGLGGLTLEVLAEMAPTLPGIRFESAIATDYAAMQVVARREEAATAGALLVKVLAKPVFDQRLVDLVKARRIAALSEREARQRTIAGQAFDAIVFAGHPYRNPAEGTATEVAKRTVAEIEEAYRSSYGTKHLTLVIVGDVNAADVDAIAGGFAGWTAGTPYSITGATVAKAAPKLAYVDVPGAKEVVVLVGNQATKAGDAKQPAADIENTLFGGGPGSRLDKKLQDEMAITTGAGASFWRGYWAGSWSVAATFPTGRASEGLRAVLAEIEKARTGDASDDEVARARQALARALATQFETTAGTARALERMAGLHLPADWYATYLAALPKVTAADARAAVGEAWTQPTIVVAGDWSKLKDELGSLGYTVTPYTP